MICDKAPVREDWWHVRAAAIYGGIHERPHRPHATSLQSTAVPRTGAMPPTKARTGSRAIIRNALHQLEKAGYVAAKKGKGRMVTPLGQKLLDNSSHEVLERTGEDQSGLGKI